MKRYLKEHKNGSFYMELSGYLTNLQTTKNTSGICFVTGDHDCLTISEIINACGYKAKSLLHRSLIITIEDNTF